MLTGDYDSATRFCTRALYMCVFLSDSMSQTAVLDLFSFAALSRTPCLTADIMGVVNENVVRCCTGLREKGKTI